MNAAVIFLPFTLSQREQGKMPLTFSANLDRAQRLQYGLDNREIDSWNGREIFISSEVFILVLGVPLSFYSVDKGSLLPEAE
jgi:hypothetical protein